MNINDVYLCEVCLMLSRNHSNGRFEYESVGKELVCKIDGGIYIDLNTGEFYSFGPSRAFPGNKFIDMKNELIPITEIINFRFKNVSKNRILKKYDKYKKVDLGECK